MENLSDINSSIENMTLEDFKAEIFNLKNLQLKQVEEYEQQLHDLKRQLATSKAMEEHLSLEIESLQNTDDAKTKQLHKKISNLEEEINSLKQKNSETVHHYEVELTKKNSEMENTIENMKSNQNTTVITNEEIEKYADEIEELKLKINKLTNTLIEIEIKYKDITFKNATLENKNTELSQELMELRECLQSKNSALEENKELISNLQEEITILQMEVNNLKSLPINKAAKGNSLFAEVDDNRVKLQKRMQIMTKKYEEMQIKYRNKSRELQKLHLEYLAIIKEIENKNDSCEDELEVTKTYKKHFEHLNDTIKLLEKELENQKRAYSQLEFGDMKYAMEMLNISRSEVLTLQRKVNFESLGLAFSEQSHFNTKKDLKKYQTELIKLRAEIVSLKQLIEDKNAAKSPPSMSDINEQENLEFNFKENVQWQKNSTSMLTHIDESLLNDNTMEDIFDSNFTTAHSNTSESSYKENISGNERKMNTCENAQVENVRVKNKVSFKSNVLEPKLTNRSGRKVINVLPIHISNIKKT